MKHSLLISLAAGMLLLLGSCGNKQKSCNCGCNCGCDKCTCSKENKAKDQGKLDYKVVDKKNVDFSKYKADKDGFITLFDGKTLTGWRGYGLDVPPTSWSVEDGAIKLKGSGTGEAQAKGGGDLIFAHKFKNFELDFEYKISKGGNSGVFYLAQEVMAKQDGKDAYLPIWQSSSEFQVLDNANPPDAQLGVDGDRQAASLYDMIPAKPQNAKPFGQWNTAKIMVYEGTVIHGQNGKNVVEYHLWTPKWTEMLQNSKFKEGGDFPYAYELLNNMGGDKHEGYIGFQDHGDDVWYRNIRIKELK